VGTAGWSFPRCHPLTEDEKSENRVSSIKRTGEAARRAAVEAAHGRGKKRPVTGGSTHSRGDGLRRATTTAAYWQGEAAAEVEAANR
jgi:hypothetical protein